MQWRITKLPIYSEREFNEDLIELIQTGQAATFHTSGNRYEITFAASENAWRLDAAGRERMPVGEALRRLNRLNN